jgi:hypothetical protein
MFLDLCRINLFSLDYLYIKNYVDWLCNVDVARFNIKSTSTFYQDNF